MATEIDGLPEQKQVKSPDDWVLLNSADGFAFMVKRKVAMGSGTLKNMLDSTSQFKEAIHDTCPVDERGAVVEKICEYLVHKNTYDNAGPKDDVPEFTTRIPPEMALELLVAADYLEA